MSNKSQIEKTAREIRLELMSERLGAIPAWNTVSPTWRARYRRIARWHLAQLAQAKSKKKGTK